VFFALGFFLSGFQGYFLGIILIVQSRELQLSESDIKIQYFMNFMGMFLGYVLLGVFSDRLGRKKVLVIGLILLTFTLFVYSMVSD
jgi:MFS family permease